VEVGSKKVVDCFSSLGCNFLLANSLHKGMLIVQVIMALQERVESERKMPLSYEAREQL